MKKARINKAWSQVKLTNELGKRYGLIIDPSSISRYERGEVQPELEIAAMMAETLGFSLDESLGIDLSCENIKTESLIKKILAKLTHMSKEKLIAIDFLLT